MIFFLKVTQAAWKKSRTGYKSKRVLTSHRLDSCCENSDFLFRATCIITNSFSQNNSSALKTKIPVQSDQIRVLLMALYNYEGRGFKSIIHWLLDICHTCTQT